MRNSGSMTAMTTELAPGVSAVTGIANPARPHRVSLDDPSLYAWRAFLHAHARLTRRLDEELQVTHGLSLAEYDALVQLALAPERRLRMSALADRVLLSRSGVTRLVDRLVADGMVERTACETDARGADASLTEAGLFRLREASGTHLGGIHHYFLEMISADDQGAIARGLSAVVDGLNDQTATERAIVEADA